MNNERRVDTGDPSHHFDGKYEGPTSNMEGGPAMGVRNDINVDHPFEKNPFHLSKVEDKEMKRFNKVIGGNKVEE